MVTVTSDAHSAARLDLSDLNLERGWDSSRSYANSKLANILFTRELARRLDGTGVTANCPHPGVVRTGFGRQGRPLLKVGITIARPFLLSPERGADTVVYLASSPDVAGQSGGYYVKRQRREPSAAARDDDAARKLWQISQEMTGLAPPGPPEAEARSRHQARFWLMTDFRWCGRAGSVAVWVRQHGWMPLRRQVLYAAVR